MTKIAKYERITIRIKAQRQSNFLNGIVSLEYPDGSGGCDFDFDADFDKTKDKISVGVQNHQFFTEEAIKDATAERELIFYYLSIIGKNILDYGYGDMYIEKDWNIKELKINGSRCVENVVLPTLGRLGI